MMPRHHAGTTARRYTVAPCYTHNSTRPRRLDALPSVDFTLRRRPPGQSQARERASHLAVLAVQTYSGNLPPASPPSQRLNPLSHRNDVSQEKVVPLQAQIKPLVA